MAKSKVKKIEEVVQDTVKVFDKTVLLRDKSTGVFSEGKKPKGVKSASGNRGGVPFWEV